MLTDYHMHLERDECFRDCRFTFDRIKVYVDAAASAGIDEIGITEHCHRFSAFRPLMQGLAEGPGAEPLVQEWLPKHFNEELDRYVDTILQAKTAGLPVLLGLEVDYLPGRMDEVADILEAYPWDYLLGSVHFVGKWAIDASPDSGWPGRDVDEAYEAYFSHLQEAAGCGVFDVLSHPDLIKKFGHRPRRDPAPLYEAIASAAAAAGVAVELSAAGWHKPVGEAYPTPALTEAFQRRGVPITFASDAHAPEQVGRDTHRLVELAQAAGYTHLSRFSNRNRTQVPLPHVSRGGHTT